MTLTPAYAWATLFRAYGVIHVWEVQSSSHLPDDALGWLVTDSVFFIGRRTETGELSKRELAGPSTETVGSGFAFLSVYFR